MIGPPYSPMGDEIVVSNKHKGSRKRQLDQSIKLARDVLRVCARDKSFRGYHIWVFALLAKIVGSAQSMRILVDAGHRNECPLILRSIYDDCISMQYILADPSKSQQLASLFLIEKAVDDYEELKVVAQIRRKSLAQVVAERPKRRGIIRKFEKAKRHPVFNSGQKDQPKRWRQITVDEKLKRISKTGRSPLQRFFSASLGNAIAHARPLALKNFVGQNPDGSIRFPTRVSGIWYKTDLLLRLTAICVAFACREIIQQYLLGDEFRKRVYEVGSSIAPDAFKEE